MERELAQVSSAIREAGKRAMDLSRKGFEVQIKKDRSPVTTADLEVNRVLHEMQETYFPDDMKAQQFYRPVDRGMEAKIREKLNALRDNYSKK